MKRGGEVGGGMYTGRVHACACPCVPGVHRETAGLGDADPEVGFNNIGEIISVKCKYLVCEHYITIHYTGLLTYLREENEKFVSAQDNNVCTRETKRRLPTILIGRSF